MKFTIDTDVLKKHELSIGEFLVLLFGYFKQDYKTSFYKVLDKKLAEKNLYEDLNIVMSDTDKNFVVELLTKSNEKVSQSKIDFDKLALQLQDLYPNGHKAGTSYSWKGKTEEIAQKLRLLVMNHDFYFTEEEAVNAVKSYVNSFEKPYKNMLLLKYFILKLTKHENGEEEFSSLFMTTIENNRENGYCN